MKYLRESKAFAWMVYIFFAGLIILTYNKMTFLFVPLQAIITTMTVPVILTLFIYYSLLPTYNFIMRKTNKRWLAITTVYLILFATFLFFILTMVPTLLEEIASFIRLIPTIISGIADEIESFLVKQNISSQELIGKLNEWDLSVSKTIRNAVENLGAGISSTVNFTVTFFINLFTVPVLLYYLFKDGPKGSQKIIASLPLKYQNLGKEIFQIFNEKVGGYTSGRLILCLYVAVFQYIVFKLVGLPNALLLGVLCGLFDIIPYFGPFIGVTPALLVASTKSWWAVVIVAVGITIVQQAESSIVSPLVMENNLNIHPVTTIVVLLVSGKLYGVLGMILALPVYAIVRDIILAVIRFMKENNAHQDFFFYDGSQ